jgi:hypothetical protein
VNPTRVYMFALHVAVVAGAVWVGLRLIEAIAGP